MYDDSLKRFMSKTRRMSTFDIPRSAFVSCLSEALGRSVKEKELRHLLGGVYQATGLDGADLHEYIGYWTMYYEKRGWSYISVVLCNASNVDAWRKAKADTEEAHKEPKPATTDISVWREAIPEAAKEIDDLIGRSREVVIRARAFLDRAKNYRKYE